jgi:hypothetical protein
MHLRQGLEREMCVRDTLVNKLWLENHLLKEELQGLKAWVSSHSSSSGPSSSPGPHNPSSAVSP